MSTATPSPESTKAAPTATPARGRQASTHRWRWPAGLVALAVAVALPYLLPATIGLLVVVGIFFIVILGLNLLTGYAGQVSLGQTFFMAIGGYGAGLLTLELHWPTVLAAIVMAAVSGAVATVLGTAFLRLRGYYFALATLGLAVITESLATAASGLTGGPSGLVGVPSLHLGGLVVFSDTSNYYVLLVLGVAGAAFIANLQRGHTGRVLSAIATDPAAAAMLGVKASRYKTTAFAISAVYASVGGSLYAYYLRFFSPAVIGVTIAFSIVIMLALGGSRTLIGPLLGALVLQGLPVVGQSFSLWEPLVAGILLILVITYLPSGIWGSAKNTITRLFTSRAGGDR